MTTDELKALAEGKRVGFWAPLPPLHAAAVLALIARAEAAEARASALASSEATAHALAAAAGVKLAEALSRADIERMAAENRGRQIVTLEAKLAEAERAHDASSNAADRFSRQLSEAEAKLAEAVEKNARLRGKLAEAEASARVPDSAAEADARALRENMLGMAEAVKRWKSAGECIEEGYSIDEVSERVYAAYRAALAAGKEREGR